MSDNLQLSPAGLLAIQRHEGLRLAPYQDAAGYWTVGYGHKMGPLDDSTETITSDRAAELLRADAETAVNAVNALVAVPLSQSQFDALVSFVYNVGAGAFRGSTLLRVLNDGDYAQAAGEFNRWNRAGGVVLAGLVSRRADESQLFAQGIA
jgi:lysozyme